MNGLDIVKFIEGLVERVANLEALIAPELGSVGAEIQTGLAVAEGTAHLVEDVIAPPPPPPAPAPAATAPATPAQIIAAALAKRVAG